MNYEVCDTMLWKSEERVQCQRRNNVAKHTGIIGQKTSIGEVCQRCGF